MVENDWKQSFPFHV